MYSKCMLAALVLATAAGANHALAQSVYIGGTELTLGMSSVKATTGLSQEFKLTPESGAVQSWIIIDSAGPSDFRVRGQIVAVNGKLVYISKDLSPDNPTPATVGEAVFAALDRLATDVGTCRVHTSRQGMESGPGAGGTMLSASIKCASYSSSLTIFQGSDPNMSHNPTIAFELQSPRPWR